MRLLFHLFHRRAQLYTRSMAGDESSRERALSAVGFLLLVFGLAAVLQCWGFLHVTNANAAVTQTAGHKVPSVPLITDSEGARSQTLRRHTLMRHTQSMSVQPSAEIHKMMADYQDEKRKLRVGMLNNRGS